MSKVLSREEGISNLGFKSLKDRHRQERDDYPTSIGLRVHRALSWLDRAERCGGEDDDARFVFLWIAFNSAYSNELGDDEELTEQEIFRNFIGRLVDLDSGRLLYETVWSQFSGSIRMLLDNRYVFGPFWGFHNGRISESEWQKRFDKAKWGAKNALARTDTKTLLTIVFSRLYVLRNQIIHGGATWNSKVNRQQVHDCANILGRIVPIVIVIMMNNPTAAWGDPRYPVVDD